MADTYITIHTSGVILFVGHSKNPMPGSKQGCGNCFTFVGLNRLPVKEKFKGFAPDKIPIQAICLQSIRHEYLH